MAVEKKKRFRVAGKKEFLHGTVANAGPQRSSNTLAKV